MKSALIGCICVGAALSLLLNKATVFGRETGRFEPDHVDFGTVFGSAPEVELRWENHGSVARTISYVYAGCGCIDAQLISQSEIPPGHAATVKIRLDISRIRRGEHTYKVQLGFADGSAAATTVQYRHVPQVLIEPQRLSVTDADLAKAGGVVLTLTTEMAGVWAVKSVTCTIPSVSIQALNNTVSQQRGSAVILRAGSEGSASDTLNESGELVFTFADASGQCRRLSPRLCRLAYFISEESSYPRSPLRFR